MTLVDTKVEVRLRRGFILVVPFQAACWDDPEELLGSQGFCLPVDPESQVAVFFPNAERRNLLQLEEAADDIFPLVLKMLNTGRILLWKQRTRYLRGSEMESSIDNAINGIYREEGVAEQELRLGVPTRNVSCTRAKIAYQLSHEFGISRTEIARQLGYILRRLLKPFRPWKEPRISVNVQRCPVPPSRENITSEVPLFKQKMVFQVNHSEGYV